MPAGLIWSCSKPAQHLILAQLLASPSSQQVSSEEQGSLGLGARVQRE